MSVIRAIAYSREALRDLELTASWKRRRRRPRTGRAEGLLEVPEFSKRLGIVGVFPCIGGDCGVLPKRIPLHRRYGAVVAIFAVDSPSRATRCLLRRDTDNVSLLFRHLIEDVLDGLTSRLSGSYFIGGFSHRFSFFRVNNEGLPEWMIALSSTVST